MKKIIKYFLILAVLILANFFIINMVDIDFNIMPKLSFEAKSDFQDDFQIFYIKDYDELWSEENSKHIPYTDSRNFQKLETDFPEDTEFLRVDTGTKLSGAAIANLKIIWGSQEIPIINITNDIPYKNDILDFNISSDNIINMTYSGNDPYFIIDLKNVNISSLDNPEILYNKIVKLILCAIISIFIVIIGLRVRFIFDFFRTVIQNRRLIWNLSKNDFKTKFSGSFFGIIWAFIQPVITIIVYWFVFQIGFRNEAVHKVPFVLWLVTGLVPWFFFSEALMNGTMSLFEYSYLVKKVVFKVSIIPIVKIISALFVHLFFILFTLIIFTCYGFQPDIYVLQVIYYTLCMIIFTLGLSYAACSIVVFFKDLSQIINIFLQIGVWFTPIMWDYTIIEAKYRILFKINPLFYIVQGYRDSFIDKYWFWERINYSIYFWIITIGLFGFGTIIFRKLKVHFADIL